MNKRSMFAFVVIVLAIILANVAKAPAATNTGSAYKPVVEQRIEVPCESPKFEANRTQATRIVQYASLANGTASYEQYGFRFAAGCASHQPAPVVETVSKVDCPANTTPLFGEDMSLSMGTITNSKGDWVAESRHGIMMAKGGRTITVTFPTPVTIHSVLVYDNDPKPGETGWSINGVSLPTTEQGQWLEPFVMDLVTDQITFDKGDDSPHFNVCIQE